MCPHCGAEKLGFYCSPVEQGWSLRWQLPDYVTLGTWLSLRGLVCLHLLW